VIRGLTIWGKVVAAGWAWAAGSLCLGEFTMGKPIPQEPQAQSGTKPATDENEKQEEPKEAKKTSEDQDNPDPDATPVSGYGLKDLGKDFLGDQKQIWTSPVRLRFADVDWLVPVGGFAAGLFATSARTCRTTRQLLAITRRSRRAASRRLQVARLQCGF
jgi:hypothetical protein